MFKEFKKFALRGNVLDLAIGVIIGGAFGKIVSSLVNDIIMPVFGIIIGGINFSSLKWDIGYSGKSVVSINYGTFIQNVIDFLIISFSIFLIVKGINSLKKKADKEDAPNPSKEEILLTEIRDILREKNN